MFNQLAAFFFAFSSINALHDLDWAFCQQTFAKQVQEARLNHSSVRVTTDDDFSKKSPCSVVCVLEITDKNGTRKDYSEEDRAPDYTRCGNDRKGFCHGGNCVGYDFCYDQMWEQEDDMENKKSVIWQPNPNAKPCEVYCNMTKDHKTETKMFQAPDYAMCGSDSETGLANVCKIGKCLKADGGEAKNPEKTFLLV